MAATPSPFLVLVLAAAPAAAEELRLGARLCGEITDADPWLPAGDEAPMRGERWRLHLEEPEVVTVAVRSLDFDAWVAVGNEDGTLLGADDDGDEPHALLTLGLRASGPVWIQVCSRHEEPGRYELAVTAGPPPRRSASELHARVRANWREVLAHAQQGGVATSPLVGFAWQRLAECQREDQEFEEAERCFRRALEVQAEVWGPDHPNWGRCAWGLSGLLTLLGRLGEAEALLDRARDVFEQAFGEADQQYIRILHDQALLRAEQGDYRVAEDLLRRGIALHDRMGVHPFNDWRHPLLEALARVYRLQGRPREALPLLERALEITRRRHGTRHEQTLGALSELAFTYRDAGLLERCEPLLRQALQALEESQGRASRSALVARANLAAFCAEHGAVDEAVELARQAVAVSEALLGPQHPDTGITLRILGSALRRSGEREGALDCLDRALLILDAQGRDPVQRIRAFRERAFLHEARGEPDRARADLEDALRDVEALRTRAAGTEWEREALFFQHRPVFDQAIALALAQGDVERAFEGIERARARSFLEQIALAGIDLIQTVPAPLREPLLQQRRDARRRVAELASRRGAGPDGRDRPDLPDEEGRAALETARAAQAEVEARIRAHSRLYQSHALSNQKVVDVDQAQREIAGPDGVLALYHVGVAESFLLVVPPRGESVARTLEVSADAAARLGIAPGPATAESLAQAVARVLAAVRRDVPGDRGLRWTDGTDAPTLREVAAALAEVLLPRPLREAWARDGIRRLVLAPDGALVLLPFEFLVLDEEAPTYLLEQAPPVAYVPSATVACRLRQRSLAAPVAPQQSLLLTVGDPAFQPAWDGAAEGDAGNLEAPLPELPGTRQESDAVRALFGAERCVQLTGADATEPAVRAELPGKRFVHLATHGFVDASHGNLFGALRLSAPAEPSDDPAGDGALTLAEIYELPLEHCRLAVLSACDTSRGPRLPADAAVTLLRGFLVAGADRVVGTTWPVADASTALLMEHFFRPLAQASREGRALEPARALREAKLELLRSERWSDPFYWAPFVLVGLP